MRTELIVATIAAKSRNGSVLVVVPAELLQRLAAPGGGQVALVIGAGCSIAEPTGIPLAGDLAEEAVRQLILNGRLQDGQCPDPRDLGALASLIHELSGGQAELVRTFPLDRMRLARPNAGYKLLIALMAEGAISHVLSLNFDLAVQHAASALGVEIEVVTAPGAQVPVRPTLVHLHGNADSAPDEMVLRIEKMTIGWKDGWQQVVAQQILGAPVVLFAGLGSAAPVLTATIDMIQGALDGNKILYQADPSPFDANGFAAQLNIPEDRYILGSWNDVLKKLGDRIAADQVAALSANGGALLGENAFEQADRDRFAALVSKHERLSLLTLGRLRAFAELDVRKLYRPHSQGDDEQIVEPMVKLARLAEGLGFDAHPTPAGTWVLKRGDQQVAQLVLATGRGARGMAAIEPRAKGVCDCIEENSLAPLDFFLVGGVLADAPALGHIDLIADEDPADIIGGLTRPMLISANDAEYIDVIGRLLNVA